MNLYYDLGNYTKELRKKFVELNKRETRLLHYQRNKNNDEYKNKMRKHIYRWIKKKKEKERNKKKWDKFYKSINKILLNKIKRFNMIGIDELIQKIPLIKINYLKDNFCLLCNLKYDNINKHKKSKCHKENYKKYQLLDIKYSSIRKF